MTRRKNAPPPTRKYLTRAKVQAVLDLASRGRDELQAELDDLLQYGELERADLSGPDQEEHDRLVGTLALGEQAREILASRVKAVQL